MTVFSNLPTLRLFGWLSALAMLTALIADLFILRPVVTLLFRQQWHKKTAAAASIGRRHVLRSLCLP